MIHSLSNFVRVGTARCAVRAASSGASKPHPKTACFLQPPDLNLKPRPPLSLPLCWLLFAVLFFTQPTSAQPKPLSSTSASPGGEGRGEGGISDTTLARIDFAQNLNAQLPLNLRFVDESGKSVQLGDYFGSKPVILVMGYYGCPMLCTLVLNGLVESLQDMRWRAGDQFEVVNVSINPDEQPSLAAAKKRAYLKRYGRVGTTDGWHFLTGREPEIRELARTVGFEYQFDPISRQYAHPSGLVILTPRGKVAQYLFGVSFSSQEVFNALHKADENEVGSPIQKLILLCFHYNPLRGKYSPTIMGLVRLSSVITVLGIVALILVSSRKPKTA